MFIVCMKQGQSVKYLSEGAWSSDESDADVFECDMAADAAAFEYAPDYLSCWVEEVE